jgi:hypothetical protein
MGHHETSDKTITPKDVMLNLSKHRHLEFFSFLSRTCANKSKPYFIDDLSALRRTPSKGWQAP